MTRLALGLVLCVAACGGDDDGGSGPGDDAGVDDAAPNEADAGPPATCEDYCAVIAAACLEGTRQYDDRASCLATCALFPPGETGDESGDSLACRAHHAALAVSEPEPHCYHAGPSGDGVCGEPCDGYCDLMLPTCPDLYQDDADCMIACAGFPDPRPYSVLESRTDTVACRIFHATLATTTDGHCGTASPGSPTCMDE